MNWHIRLTLSLLVALLPGVTRLVAQQPTERLLFTEFPAEGTPVNLLDLNAHRGPSTDQISSVVMVAALGEICELTGTTGAPINPLMPWGSAYRGPINFAVGTLSDGGTNEIVMIVAPGGPSNLPVRLFGSPGPSPMLIGDVNLPPGTSPGGRFIGMANLIGDASNEIIFGRGLKGPGSVEAVDVTGRVFFSYTPFGQTPDDEVRLSFADVVGDGGRHEIISTTAHGSEVKVHEIVHGDTAVEIGHGFPFAITPSGGVWTAAFDLNGDGVDDLITVPGSGPPHVRAFNLAGPTPTVLGDFFAFPPDSTNGDVPNRVSAGLFDGRPAIVVTSGPQLRVFQSTPSGDWTHIPSFAPTPFGGVLPNGMDLQVFLRSIR